MKAQIKNYMSLTKKEWNGMLVLVILIVAILAAPYAYQWYHKDSTINIKEFNEAVLQLKKANPGSFSAGNNSAAHNLSKPLYFKFDPNNLPADRWKMLGLTDKQITTIQHYHAKGGRFYKAADFKKIYGIADSNYKALAPYMQISAVEMPIAEVVELNTADSAKLTALNGIGPSFATRIIYYRERLGGFVNKEQLKEVFGFDELKYNELKGLVKVDPRRIKKIAINTITFDQLRLMPYLNYKQVNAIIEYRKQHGNYSAMADLKNIAIVDEGILRKIEPYISYK
ncbi:hypothetical protein A0256_11545 [Mucilaginibacter sp. PAMC 26640]|nr:hypothetical protein A0256_11545 [Mucilaginibacter sp. PAMC 26640]